MSDTTRQRSFHFKDIAPADPAVRRWGQWLPANRSFYGCFRRWLRDSGYSDSAIGIYGVAARQALGLLDRPYWTLDPQADLQRALHHFLARPIRPTSKDGYRKGLRKLADYLRLRCHRPPAEKAVNWGYYLGSLPPWLTQGARDFVAHCRRAWPTERRRERTSSLLSHLTRFLRWAAAHHPLQQIADLDPKAWFAYLDQRLEAGIRPVSLNSELRLLQQFLRFTAEAGRPICQRTLLLEPLEEGDRLPRDLPIALLRRLLAAVQSEAASSHRGQRRTGRMDLAWFLLMLHSGLRTGEVRHLRLADLDLDGRRVRVEQSKGLKDRVVFLSQGAVRALQEYLELRGPAEALPDYLFIYRHAPLSQSYCYERLRTCGERCGVRVTPHQLRHSCATLLLNAGAPILTVQAILGHQHVDTTLGYARLYDGTVAADYYRAMAQVESRLALPESACAPPPTAAELLALVDWLQAGTLNGTQAATLQVLRAGILAVVDQEITSDPGPNLACLMGSGVSRQTVTGGRLA